MPAYTKFYEVGSHVKNFENHHIEEIMQDSMITSSKSAMKKSMDSTNCAKKKTDFYNNLIK